jgi:putative oxidoreductase
MFAFHGGQQILGFPPGAEGMLAETLGIIGAWIEVAAGFMIALGFLTRIAALIASSEMALGYFIAHAPGGLFPIQNPDELVLFYRWFFFFVVFYGPGRWSLDVLVSNRGSAATPAAT